VTTAGSFPAARSRSVSRPVCRVSERSTQAGAPPSNSPHGHGVRGSVLVVDDDPAFRRLVHRVLAGFELGVVGEAASVASALSAAATLRPAAVLVDIGLPDGDGISLARQLVALPWRPRVLLTSSDAEAATPGDVDSSGARAFVPKDQLPNAALDQLLGD
jgi:DNA-binding NarL/FixJ family response regulator